MIKWTVLAVMVAAMGLSGCGKRGPLNLPSGVESLPDDPSQRSDPPA